MLSHALAWTRWVYGIGGEIANLTIPDPETGTTEFAQMAEPTRQRKDPWRWTL